MTRNKVILITGLCLAALSVAVVTLSYFSLARKSAKVSQTYNKQATALLGDAFVNIIKNSLESSQLAISTKISDEAISGSKTIIAATMIEWQKETFAYSKRVDNQVFLRSHDLDPKSIDDVLASFTNDIANAGPSQEQLYAGILGSDTPVLVAITPLKGAPNDPPLSVAAVIEAKSALSLLEDNTLSQTFVVDRYGTLLLAHEQERAIHRESILQNKLVKSLITSGATEISDAGSVAKRIPFAGVIVVSQMSDATTFGLARESVAVLSLGSAIGIIVLLTFIYLILPADQRSVNDTGMDEEMKLAG